MPKVRKQYEIDALRMLEGCPSGATIYAMRLNKVNDRTIYNLVRRGAIEAREYENKVIPDRPFMVTWLYITENGKKLLNARVNK